MSILVIYEVDEEGPVESFKKHLWKKLHRKRDPDRNPNEWFMSKSEVLEAIDRLDGLGVLRKQK